MAEEKAEKNEKKKKTPGVAKKIFKWLGLGVVCVLLLGAIVFAAPWKVTTLLVIILAACTVLPKPARKWFWASVGVIVIALIVWVFLPEADGDWRAYTFDEELAALEAKRAIPDEENAAGIYNELLEIPLLDGNEPEFFARSRPSSKSGPWLSKDHPEMAEWLQQHQAMINTLLKASKIEKCRFPIAGDLNDLELRPPRDFEAVMAFWWRDSDRISQMRRWSDLLILAANNDFAEGRAEQAIEKYTAVLQMGKHLYQQPTNLNMLMGLAFERLAIEQLNRFLATNDATDNHLMLIDQSLQSIKYDLRSDLLKVFESEKLYFKSLMCGISYQTNPKGEVRLNRDPRSTLRSQIGLGLILVLGKSTRKPMNPDSFWQRKFTKAETIFCWFFVPSSPHKAAKIIDSVYEKYYHDYDWQKEPRKSSLTSIRPNYRCMMELMAVIFELPYYRIHDLCVETLAKQRGSRLIIALRRYRNKTDHWPESLEDIKSSAAAEVFVDPINNTSFIYKLTEENFTLYSKGKNNIDESGENDATYAINLRNARSGPHIECKKDDIAMWPPRSCKAKEENADVEQ